MRGPVSGLFFVLSILHAGLQSPALSSTISLMKNTRILTILMLVFLLALTVVLAMVPAPYSTYIAMAYPALLAVVGTVIFIGAAASVLLAVLIPLCLYFLFWREPFMPGYFMMLLTLTVTAVVTGICFWYLNKPFPAALLGVLSGRIVLGIAQVIYHYANDVPYVLEDYLEEAFFRCWPGLIAAVVLIPLIHYLIYRKEEERVK